SSSLTARPWDGRPKRARSSARGMSRRSLSLRYRYWIISLLLFFALQIRNPFLHPFGRGRSFQEVIEEFLQPPRVIFLVGAAAQTVRFAVVVEHIDFFVQSPESQVVLDALIPRHGVVVVVVEHQNRGLDAARVKDGRVFDEAHRVFPQAAADAALRAFVLELARQPGAPSASAVGAGHIAPEGAGRGGFEAVGLRDHIRDLITAPTVALNADGVFVDEALVDDRLNRGQHAFERALAGIADGVNDVGHQDQIAVTGVKRGVDRMARTRIDEPMYAFRELFVNVDDHRILPLRIEIVRLDQYAAQRDAVRVLVPHQLGLAPCELIFLLAGVADLLQALEAGVGD